MKYFHIILLFCIATNLQAQTIKKRNFSSYTGAFSDSQPGSIDPNTVYNSEQGLSIYAWTQGGQENITRPFLRWDLSSIPNKSKILSATLMLYHNQLFPVGSGQHQGDNAFFVQRITGNWSELSMNWQNQPSVTSANQVYVPNATSPAQNYCIDVTKLLQDMVNDTINGRNGLRLSLVNEFPYTAVFLASSENPDCTRHPQLLVTYEDAMVSAVNEVTTEVQFASFMPNPANHVVSIEARQDLSSNDYLMVRAFNLQGQLVGQYKMTTKSMDINTSSFSNGSYIFKIESKSGDVQSDVILIQH
jgi:hypothetical protein